MKYFSRIDIIIAFNNIQIREEREYLNLFWTRFGLFHSLIMPFELTSTPVTFQLIINNILYNYLDIFYTVYLDNILISSCSRIKHKEYIYLILIALKEAKLFAKLEKCKSFCRRNYLLSNYC